VSAEFYNQLFTMHGTTMIFLAIMPLSAAFFNFLIPLQIGARDVAFPRLNAFSYWVYLFGGIFITLPILFQAAPNGGWFGYVPLTTRDFSQGINIDFWVIGLQVLGVSSLAAAFNFLTTIINLRAPGMTLMRMPMFTWMAFVVQFLLVLAFPVITVALVFLLFDRFFGTNFYAIHAGADPLLWQHLFWIFGHPEVYILILPAFGLVSEVLPTYSGKPLFGYPVMVYSGILIGVLGFGVWAHHMFAVGMGPIADSIFALSTMLIGIPTGVKIFNWMATMAQGSLRFTTSMMFGIALVALFTIGGISGVMHSSPPADLQQTDTYFIVAHFHYVLFGGSIMGIFAGIYHYYPKITGRLLNETLGKWHFWLNFVGMNLTFFPMHFSGMLGMPRRIYTYDSGQGWDSYNLMSSIGAYIIAVATLIFAYNFLTSRKRGAIAGHNPWNAGTLEWTIPSPPPEYNFAVLPTVTSRYPIWEGNEIDRESARINGQEGKSAEELGIAIPYSTIKPLIVAFGLITMFTGLITTRVLIFVGAAILVGGLYAWLCAPLEPEHH
jgi:cytochrome c oxidase subunit 1